MNYKRRELKTKEFNISFIEQTNNTPGYIRFEKKNKEYVGSIDIHEKANLRKFYNFVNEFVNFKKEPKSKVKK